MSEVTRLIDAAQAGDRNAAADLLPLVYNELRKLAAGKMANEAPGHTLDATGLVHEAYLRLVGELKFDNRGHFFAAAALAMKRVLVENVRHKGRLKRGGGSHREAVDFDGLAAGIPDEDLLALHDALERLASLDLIKAQIVELRFFGGMSLPEIAEHLGISLSTAERGWRYARAWLYTVMSGEEKSSHE